MAYLSRLRLTNFRNLVHLDVGLSPGVTVYYGPNAQGKTTLLEAVYLLCIARSFRAENERAARVDSDDLVELSKSALGRVRDGKPNPKVTNRSSGLVQTQPPNGKAQKRA